MSITVRRARRQEFEAIGELAVLGYSTLSDREAVADYEPVLRDVAARADSAEVLVAILDGQLVGSVTFVDGPGPQAEVDDPDAATIRILAVAPQGRGRGVGQALVEACIERARQAGRRRVLLDTRESMESAHRLYERVGFVRDPSLDRRPADAPHVLLLGYRLELT